VNRHRLPTEFFVLLRCIALAGFPGWLIGTPAFGQSGCVNFPANYVPFSSISYVSAPDAAGDRLVVGPLAGGLTAFGNATQPASSINQEYCNAQVQLAPQQSYPNVYVPTAAERAGNFSAFAGLLLNPATNQPYPNGVIPASQLGNPYFAWRIAANPLNITSVQNAASNITPGLPNAGVAQGSIFIVQGSSLGPANISIAPAAFQSTSLSNTSVAVTVGGTTVNALMYYTSAAQVAALLPSNAPTGAGTVTVTYNSQTSSPAPVTVVANNLGIFTIDSSGGGPGIVTYPDYSLVSAAKAANCGGPNTTCGAANPGDTLILWATGLGPVSGSDASGAGLGVAMPNIPLTVWLGGVQARVVYQGRSGCCIGEDQIVFTVPNNVPTGCAVPLLVQIGSEISNNSVMPVASGSRNCTPTNAGVASVNVEQAVTAGPVTYSDIELHRSINTNGTGYQDLARFQFSKILTYTPGTQPFFVSYLDDPPLGTCFVYNNLNPGTNPPAASSANLDAGSKFTITGPNGNMVVAASPGLFRVTLSAAGAYLSPGAYTVSGAGGTDIGPFNAAITIFPPPSLTSPANLVIPPVTRSNGMTLTWTGGSANALVLILVLSATDNTQTIGASTGCWVAANAGTFTVPPYALLPLPAGNNTYFEFSTRTARVPFTATGLSLGLLEAADDGPVIFGFTLK
jgi:uncharacterized protein (TIGR03437 family)